MDRILDKLISAKYKNVPFFVRTETINNIGQKRIIHDYPNSNTRYVENQGLSIFEETIDIFFSGENYQANFNDFVAAIRDPAPGRLFLPVFGIFENVVALPAPANTNHTGLGEISMSITFTETIEKPAPTEILDTQEDVSDQAQITRKSLQAQFANDYIPPNTRNNIITVGTDMEILGETVKDSTGKEKEFNRFARSISRNISNTENFAALLLSPLTPLGFLQSIAIGITGPEAFASFKQIAVSGNNLSNSMAEIISRVNTKPSTAAPQEYDPNINKNINSWDDDTIERQQRNNNRFVTVDVFRVVGLISMYETAAARNYTTTEEIDEIKNDLRQYYVELIENDTTGVLIPGVKNDLAILKNKTETVLEQKRQNAYNIIEIVLKNITPATLLAYMLYGEYIKSNIEFEFLTSLLKNLNKQIPAHRLQGKIKVAEIG